MPHKEELTERLNNDPDFETPFRGLAANSCFVKAAEESLEFQQVYSVDSEKAMGEFMHLLDDNRRYHFNLTFENGTVTTEVTANSLPLAGRG